ncbi:ankyrin repeat protein [Fowlpox virus]|nr:ankyrin repeat protein [Fowlpox virus]
MEIELYKLMFLGSDEEILIKIKEYTSKNKEENEYSLYHNLPLHYAIYARRINIIEYLLQQDYDPNVMNNMGYYPIQLISMPFDIRMLPIDSKTHTIIRRYMGKIKKSCIFTTAVSIPIAREIFNGNIDLTNSYLLSLLEKISYEELLIADLLINYGSSVDAAGGGITALHYAAQYGNLPIVRLLIAYGADVCAKTFSNDSVFLYATKSNNIDIVKEILPYLGDKTDEFKKITKIAHEYDSNMLEFLKYVGFDIKSVDDLNKTVLHYMCSSKMKNIELKKLLEEDISIDALDNEGFTALHYSIKNENIKAVRMLLEYGADVNINTKTGDTVFDLAIRTNNSEIIKLVATYYDDYINDKVALGDAICSNDIKMVCLLLDMGFNVNTTYYNTSSLLHLAIMFSSPELVKLLLEYDANPNIMDNHGTTPLESALTVWHISKKYRKEFSKIITIDLVYRRYMSPDISHSFIKNMSIIQSNVYLRKIKDVCKQEIENMKSISLNDNYSLYSLLMESNIITILEDNPSFKQRIRGSLCNFPTYRYRIEKLINNTCKSYV